MKMIVNALVTAISYVSDFVVSTKNICQTVLEVNYDAVSSLLKFLMNILGVVLAFLNIVYVACCTIVICFIDFLAELLNFVTAFLYLLWKVIILLYSFLDLIFHSIECLVYFLWTGGKWTAETLKVSGQTLSENGISTWKYFVLSVQEFTNSIIGGFATIGELSKLGIVHAYEGSVWCLNGLQSIVTRTDELIRHAFNYFFDSLYYFLKDYLLNMPREAYFGMIICFFTCLTLNNIWNKMRSRGLTFPLYGYMRSTFSDVDENEDYDGRMAEFSDDDFIDLSQDEHEDNSDIDDGATVSDNSDESDITGSSEEDEELEVPDSSDNESNAASESEMSEINIQLPDTHHGYDLRRSTTPARFSKDMSPSDVQRFIDSEKEKRMCVVCQDRSKSVLILPCRHMCLCVECGNHIARARSRDRRACPLCRTPIKTIMNVYV